MLLSASGTVFIATIDAQQPTKLGSCFLLLVRVGVYTAVHTRAVLHGARFENHPAALSVVATNATSFKVNPRIHTAAAPQQPFGQKITSISRMIS